MTLKILKTVVNIYLGDKPQQLSFISKKIGQYFTIPLKPIKSKTTEKKFGIRRGRLAGYKVTLYGKKATALVKKLLPVMQEKITKQGFSWGCKKYYDLPGLKYDPMNAIFGLGFHVILKKPGYRAYTRKRGRTNKTFKLKGDEIADYIRELRSQ